MILADKIIDLRKKMGWSQEELADQLGVSRQSVSKWESAQSLPDMDKILKMSSVFSVSTDYLLKDELGDDGIPGPTVQSSEPGLRKVTMEEASSYMEIRRRNAPILAFSSFLCVCSPILLILLSGLSEEGLGTINGPMAIGVGLCALVVMIAVAVVGFMKSGSSSSEFSFLETENFETEYGVTGLVKRNKEEFKETSNRINTIGAVLCITSLLPVLLFSCFKQNSTAILISVCVLLLLVAFAVHGFVYAGTINASFAKLLEEGEYSREEKARSKHTGGFSTVYWLLVVAASLTMMFLGVDMFWVVYPIAGVLFVPAKMLFSAIRK